jgi:3-oxoacyl-[acyl-carrier protein] reductase
LAGRVALVTGSSRGIGRHIALGLARAGCHVAVNYKTSRGAAEEVAAAVRQLGVQASAFQADCARAGEVRRLVARVEEAFGRLDVLVNNVGEFAHKPVLDHTDEEFERILFGTVGATFWASTAALPGMRARGWGRIVNLGAVGADHAGARRNIGPHLAGKSAVISLTRTMALEWGGFGVTVNAVSPGVIEDRELTREAAEGLRDPGNPVGRPGTSQDVVDAVLFLASPRASFINGACIDVSGGWRG